MSMERIVTVSPVSDSYMNLNTGSIIYDIIETIMDFIVLYPVFAILLYGLTKDSSHIIKGCLLITAVLLMILIRNYVSNNLLHYISYLPVIAVTYLVSGNITARVINTLFIIVMMGLSIGRRHKGHIEFRKVKYLVGSEIYLLIIYLVSIKLKYTGVQNLILSSSIILGTIYLVYMHISRLDTLMKWEGQKSSDDKKKINNIGIKTSILIISALLVFTAVMYGQGYFKNIDNAVVSWISDTFSPRPHQQKEQQQQKKITDSSGMDNGIPDELRTPPKKNIFLDIFVFITEFFVAALVIIVLYMFIKAMIKRLLELAFGRKQKNNEQKESLIDINDIKDSIKDIYKTIRRNGILSLSMSNNNKIRRTYFSLVNKRKKKHTVIMHSYTPFIIRSVVEGDSNIDMGEATLIYEKARYGNKECTDEELNKMRDSIK